MFQFATESLQTPKSSVGVRRRLFRYVEEIPRNEVRQYCPIPGIRSIHQIVSDISGENRIRQLSCYECDECLLGKYDNCDNDEILGFTSNVTFTAENSDLDNTCTSNESECIEQQKLSDLVSKNCIFAVMCDDDKCDFYILKANSKAIVLSNDEGDCWGAFYRKHSEIIRGNYFQQCADSPFHFKLIRGKHAIVPAQSVLYILSECDIENNKMVISEDVYQTILQSVSDSRSFV